MMIYTKDLKVGDSFTSGKTRGTVIGIQSDKGQTLVQYETIGLRSAYWTASLSMVEVN